MNRTLSVDRYSRLRNVSNIPPNCDPRESILIRNNHPRRGLPDSRSTTISNVLSEYPESPPLLSSRSEEDNEVISGSSGINCFIDKASLSDEILPRESRPTNHRTSYHPSYSRYRRHPEVLDDERSQSVPLTASHQTPVLGRIFPTSTTGTISSQSDGLLTRSPPREEDFSDLLPPTDIPRTSSGLTTVSGVVKTDSISGFGELYLDQMQRLECRMKAMQTDITKCLEELAVVRFELQGLRQRRSLPSTPVREESPISTSTSTPISTSTSTAPSNTVDGSV